MKIKKIVLILGFLSLIFLYLFKKTQPRVINPPISISTTPIVIEVTPLPHAQLSTYDGVSFFTPYHKFSLTYPRSCNETSLNTSQDFNNPILKCLVNNKSVIIIPQSGGHNANVIARDVVTIGIITWYRSVFMNNINTAESYGFDSKDGTYYVIEVQYEDYSKESKNFVYSILSTFSSKS